MVPSSGCVIEIVIPKPDLSQSVFAKSSNGIPFISPGDNTKEADPEVVQPSGLADN